MLLSFLTGPLSGTTLAGFSTCNAATPSFNLPLQQTFLVACTILSVSPKCPHAHLSHIDCTCLNIFQIGSYAHKCLIQYRRTILIGISNHSHICVNPAPHIYFSGQLYSSYFVCITGATIIIWKSIATVAGFRQAPASSIDGGAFFIYYITYDAVC